MTSPPVPFARANSGLGFILFVMWNIVAKWFDLQSKEQVVG